MGGCGYIKEFPLERMMRVAKFFQIYTRTNQIMRIVTAREIFKE
jgi:alkylation response protein AidB-like acyl-CoA dehydrogenase